MLLVLLRCVQGLGVGGEWGGAVLMAVEHGHAGRRGYYASWVQVGVPAGMVLANGVFMACQQLGPDRFLAWGWRLPFLAGIALMGIGLYIRLNIVESELFDAAKKARAKQPAKLPVLVVLRTQWREVLQAVGAKLVENTAFYLYVIFVPSYAVSLGYGSSVALSTVLIASGLQFVTIPLAGRLSDTFGRRPVYLAGTIGTGLFAAPFFALVHTGQYPWLLLAMILALGILHALMYGPQAAFLSELFRTEVRYSGASLGYQLASLVAGGLAPLVATELRQRTGGAWWSVAAYLIVCAVITCGTVLMATETSRKDLRE